MGNSWGHILTRITGDEATVHTMKCSMSKCPERAEYWLTYRYVTGRAGRTSHATKRVCRQHAQKYTASGAKSDQ